jgi:DNA-binding response OmpR family regulator/putative methionine-R-sulfoxide reductase with GAF domain
VRAELATSKLGVTGVAEKPRLLVIDRDSGQGKSTHDFLSEAFNRVTVRTVSKALALLRDQRFDAVYVDASQLSAVRWVGMMIQAEEILDAISDGVAVVDPDLRIIWANPEFHLLTDTATQVVGCQFYQALGQPEILGPDPCPFTSAVAAKAPASTAVKIGGNRYLRLTVTPVFDGSNALTHLIALTRETTDETQQQLKVDAIHEAGDQLADLTPEELAEMAVEERTDLLKYNIARHMKNLLGLDFIEIRLLDRSTNRLVPLLTEGMTPLAANRELYARKEGNGVTGYVAATGISYLCPDTTKDPLYIEGAAGSRSSLTVPLIIHGTVIGTLNVESPQPDAFDDRDRQFIEIYGRNIAAALNTLELLEAEKVSTASASVEAINRELALPLDDIITDATTVLDRYAGHDEDIIARLRHLLYRAREIRSLIHKAGSTVVPQPRQSQAAPAPRLAGTRILVVDTDEAVRRSAHHLLGCQGASVETARDAHEAIALMRQAPYSAALVDIRLPDMDGYESFKRLREVQPNVPVILMTGFGWDPSHSIVKARQEGLQTVLYKPFRADRLMEAVEQALRTAPAVRSATAVHHDGASAAAPVGSSPTPLAPPSQAADGAAGAAAAEPVIDHKLTDSRPIEASHDES